MYTTCPKCRYARKPEDTAPEWQCPACGIVYEKFDANPPVRVEPRPLIYAAPDRVGMGRTAKLAIALLAVGLLYFAYDKTRRFVRGTPATLSNQAGSMSQFNGMELPKMGDGLYTMTVENGQPTARLLPEASAQLSKMTAGRVVLFSTSWCGYCKSVRHIFNEAGVKYVDLDIERDPAAADYHAKVLHAGGVPVVVMGERLILGYDEAELRVGMKELGG